MKNDLGDHKIKGACTAPEIGQRVYDYYSGTLSGEEAREFTQHLSSCLSCQETLRSLKWVVNTIQESPEYFFGQSIFVQPLGTPPDFNWDLPFPDVALGDSTTENGLLQILNIGDRPLVINQGGRRPDITNMPFTILGWDLDGIIPPLEFPLDPNPAVPAPEITIQSGDLVFMLVKFTGLDIGEQVGAIRIFTNEPVNDPNNPPCVLKNVRGSVVKAP
jgi:hypothetical protein